MVKQQLVDPLVLGKVHLRLATQRPASEPLGGILDLLAAVTIAPVLTTGVVHGVSTCHRTVVARCEQRTPIAGEIRELSDVAAFAPLSLEPPPLVIRVKDGGLEGHRVVGRSVDEVFGKLRVRVGLVQRIPAPRNDLPCSARVHVGHDVAERLFAVDRIEHENAVEHLEPIDLLTGGEKLRGVHLLGETQDDSMAHRRGLEHVLARDTARAYILGEQVVTDRLGDQVQVLESRLSQLRRVEPGGVRNVHLAGDAFGALLVRDSLAHRDHGPTRRGAHDERRVDPTLAGSFALTANTEVVGGVRDAAVDLDLLQLTVRTDSRQQVVVTEATLPGEIRLLLGNAAHLLEPRALHEPLAPLDVVEQVLGHVGQTRRTGWNPGLVVTDHDHRRCGGLQRHERRGDL